MAPTDDVPAAPPISYFAAPTDSRLQEVDLPLSVPLPRARPPRRPASRLAGSVADCMFTTASGLPRLLPPHAAAATPSTSLPQISGGSYTRLLLHFWNVWVCKNAELVDYTRATVHKEAHTQGNGPGRHDGSLRFGGKEKISCSSRGRCRRA